jgi:signal transduction histidine kinase
MKRARAGWLTFAPVAAVAAVNVAGIWGIALARRGATEEAARLFSAETLGRARALERQVGDIRANLAFLAASAPVSGLAREADPPEARRLWREATESALLVFLRSHPEVVRLELRSGSGAPLVSMGRRGGVPVLWVATAPTGDEGAAIAPDVPRLRASLSSAPDVAAGASARVELQTELATPLLLAHGDFPERSCRLQDASGAPLARRPAPRHDRAPQARQLEASASVRAEGWSAPSPWRLVCTEPETLAMGLMEPLTGRYRTILALNLAAMALAVLLGVLALREARRREQIEARAREETRVRELERQLFHAERLTTVGQLAAGIAHEVSNPLEGMANYLSLAQEDLARGDAAAASAHLEGVRHGLERAAGTVRQVLTHADPATGPRTPVDVNGILAKTVEFLRSRRDFERVAFGTELIPEPLLILGNPVMLGQVASNLVINACEAQPEGGEVVVRSRREGRHVVIEVADRGPGVPEADRRRIFDPFFSTKHSTGLGLSVCHSIARQHEGEIAVLPGSGGGAVFRLTLPALEGGHA